MAVFIGGAASAVSLSQVESGGAGVVDDDPCCPSGTDYCTSVKVEEETPTGEKVALGASCIVHTDNGVFVEGSAHAKFTNRDGVDIVDQRADVESGARAVPGGELFVLNAEPRTEDLVIFDEGDLCVPILGCNEDPISAPIVQRESFQRVQVFEGGITFTVTTPVSHGQFTVTEGCASPAWADADKKCGGNGNEDLLLPSVQP